LFLTESYSHNALIVMPCAVTLGVLILAPVTKLAQISVRFLHHLDAAGTFDVDVRQTVVD